MIMKIRLLLLIMIACLLTGCKPGAPASVETIPSLIPETTQAPTETEPPTEAVTEPPTEPDPVEGLLGTMTLEEKVGQLFLARCPWDNAAEDVAEYHLGGYILFDKDFEYRTAEEVLAEVNTYQEKAKIPLLIGVDEEGGTVVRVSCNYVLREERFQSPRNLFEEGGMERIIEDTAEKDALLSSMGINVNFAPVADIATEPGDFMYKRSFGQDARATADFTAQVVAQMAKDKMGSALKHFPGYGANVDTHTGIAVDERPLETFLENDLLPFASFAAGEGTTSIMVSHNIVTCMDETMPASLSAEVHRFLREEMNFDGIIMTDALDMGAVQEYTDGGNIAVTALRAGNDILLICDYKTGIPAILEAVEKGTVTEEMIDTACRRVLTWKQALGLI